MGRKRFEYLKVLVVDDDKHTISLITHILRSSGIREIQTAYDGSHAITLLRRTSVDLIISDWEMKPLNGYEFTTRVRNSSAGLDRLTPIIMLTAHTEIERVVKARDAGVNDFVAKPISPATLLSRILTVLENPRQFIDVTAYAGPDRRWRERLFEGRELRRDRAAKTLRPNPDSIS